MYILSFGGSNDEHQHFFGYDISSKRWKNISRNKQFNFKEKDNNSYYTAQSSRSCRLFEESIIIIGNEPGRLLVFHLYKQFFIKKYDNIQIAKGIEDDNYCYESNDIINAKFGILTKKGDGKF